MPKVDRNSYGEYVTKSTTESEFVTARLAVDKMFRLQISVLF